MGGRGGSGRSIAAQGPTAATPAATASNDPALAAIDRAIAQESNGSITSLEMARQEMAKVGISGREQQDAELLRLNRSRDVLLFPMSQQSVMTQAQRDAGVMLGNQLKALIMRG